MLFLSAMPPVEVPVPIRPLPLETHLFVVGVPTLLEAGRRRLRELRGCRPPGLAVDEVAEELMGDGATARPRPARGHRSGRRHVPYRRRLAHGRGSPAGALRDRGVAS